MFNANFSIISAISYRGYPWTSNEKIHVKKRIIVFWVCPFHEISHGWEIEKNIHNANNIINIFSSDIFIFQHDGKPYCNNPCYSALFGPGGKTKYISRYYVTAVVKLKR